MNHDDETFFGALAGAKATSDEAYAVELVKAKVIAGQEKSESVEAAWTDGEPEGQLTVDVYQTPTEIVVESAIAGVKPEHIDVNVTADTVVIRGVRHREKVVSDEDYIYRECYWGRFSRSLILPEEVDPAGAGVTFKNGILTVHMPKANKRKSHNLKVRVE
jgi:HSP20 family protein